MIQSKHQRHIHARCKRSKINWLPTVANRRKKYKNKHVDFCPSHCPSNPNQKLSPLVANNTKRMVSIDNSIPIMRLATVRSEKKRAASTCLFSSFLLFLLPLTGKTHQMSLSAEKILISRGYPPSASQITGQSPPLDAKPDAKPGAKPGARLSARLSARQGSACTPRQCRLLGGPVKESPMIPKRKFHREAPNGEKFTIKGYSSSAILSSTTTSSLLHQQLHKIHTMSTAKDLSHLLSNEAKSRQASLLKVAFKYFNDPKVVFLGGGLPLSDYFPWNKITVESPAAPFKNGIGAVPQSADETVITELHKVPADSVREDDVPLARSLQYGHTEGAPEILNFLKEHTKLIHKIPYEDWGIVTTAGNTQSWDATLRTFCDRGDTILVEEYSFSSALETSNAQGITNYPIPVDDYGIVPEKLESILNNWVGPKPKLIYTIPTGQNPTGSSLSTERRKAIYKIAQEHDLIIVEDEPYYFLQMETYTPDVEQRGKTAVHDHKNFVEALVTSFISLDTDGRVIRLDSFSKVLAPGVRLGWIVAQEKLLERFVRLHEVSIQNPSGLTQSITNGLLNRWGQEGYLDWLIGLRAEYTHKRDVAIDAVAANFPLEVSHYVPPVAGMFFTVIFDASKHPEFATKYDSDPLKVEKALYERALQEGALMIPGSWFKVNGETNPPQPKEDKEKSTTFFFRGTYAAVPLDKLTLGLERFGKAAKLEFGI